MNATKKLADLEAAKRHAQALLKLHAKYPSIPLVLTEESLSPFGAGD